MAAATIHVVPDGSFDDWIVRDDRMVLSAHHQFR
jgi:hypothetical protein